MSQESRVQHGQLAAICNDITGTRKFSIPFSSLLSSCESEPGRGSKGECGEIQPGPVGAVVALRSRLRLKIIRWQVLIEPHSRLSSGQGEEAGWEGMRNGESYDPAERPVY